MWCVCVCVTSEAIAGVLDRPAKFLRGLDRIQENLGVQLVEDILVLLLGEVGDGFTPQLELVEPSIALLIDDLPAQRHGTGQRLQLSQHYVTACGFHLRLLVTMPCAKIALPAREKEVATYGSAAATNASVMRPPAPGLQARGVPTDPTASARTRM